MKNKKADSKSSEDAMEDIQIGYSPKEMKLKYPRGGYKIKGEVYRKNAADVAAALKDGPKKEKSMWLEEPGTYSKFLYYDASFVPAGKNSFVIIKKRRKSLLVGAIIVILLIVLAAVFAFTKMNGPQIDPNAAKYKSKLKRETKDPDSILIPGYDEWHMKPGTNEVYVALLNPEGNPCYFQFTIVNDENGKELFSTKLVPPGQAVTDVKLSEKLQKGTHPVTVQIKTYSLDDPTVKLNGANVKTKIVVT